MKEEALETLSVDSDMSTILDSSKPIPFKFINWQMFISLAKKLDPDKLVNGNNWRMLAEKLGYTTEDIFLFESKQVSHGSNTIKVLTDYSHTQDSTVNNLYTALENIDRQDALDELKKGLPEIQRHYQESFRKKHPHQELMTENECACSSCDVDMSLPSKKLNSFCFDQKKYMSSMDNYPMLMNPHAHHLPMALGNKHYQRHKSVDNAHMLESMNSSTMRGYERPSPEFKRMRSVPLSESLMVRGHDSHSQFLREMEPMDHAPTLRDDPVSAARVMVRELQRYNHQGPLTGSMSGMFHSKDYDTSYHNQYGQRSGLKLEIPSPMDGYKHQIQDNFCSPSPTPTTTPSAPLVQLTKLANEKKFQPDEPYNELMRIKQEEILMKKAGHQHAQFDDMDKMGTSSSHQMQGACHGMEVKVRPIKIEDCSGRPKASEPPNTFPLRLKSSACASNSSQLIKSASLPNNMKPAEFKKAFRHIKVFVTYATDDKKHTQRVINLCKCLVKNGFTCCVDVYNKSIQDEDPDSWCMNRFEEADFILAVMSPKYRREADSCEMDNDADDSDSMDEDYDRQHGSKSHRLHTKQIYRLMYREYLQSNQRTGRFVPLLFQGMSSDLIPEWMMYAYSKLVYVWPEQYKDLLWMLTKPENRVPEHIAPVINRSLHNSSEEKENGESLGVGQESE